MSQHNLQQEAESLAQYAADGSHTAFRRVVQAGLPLVMGTALRYTGGQLATAEDIAQMVFIDLARQAKSVRGATLSGWLHKHTCFTAAKVMRGERRRVLREQASVERTSSVPDSCPERLDDLLLGLGETDREALLLRYVEGRSHDEVGDALGISRAAAQKRAERALARLRVAFHSEQFTAGGLAAVMAPPMGGAADLANRMAGQAISAGSAPTIPFLAKPVTAFLWGAAAAITLAAVPLALGWRDYSAAKATAALSDPLGTGRSRAAEPHWSMADQMRVVPLPPAPSFSNPAAAVTALLEIADRFGVGNEGCSRATALVATLPQASIHDVLLGLERGMPATIRGTNWWAEVGRLLADRWRPRQVPDDLIAVWPMLSASTRMSLFKGCAETDLPATRRLLEGFDTELRLGSFGIKSQEYHNVLREAVLAQLLKDAPKEAAAFYGTMHRQYAWDSHLVGEPALVKAADDPATRKILWEALPPLPDQHRRCLEAILLGKMSSPERRAAVEALQNPGLRAEAATTAAKNCGEALAWCASQVPESLRLQMAARLRFTSETLQKQGALTELLRKIEASPSGPEFDAVRLEMFDDGSAPYESEEDHNLLADIANHITEPVGRVKALIWAMEVLPPPLRETWMDQRLTPEEAAQFKVICRIGNYSYYAYPE